ncbi:hypothetical protein FKM82_023638 [Ascaphus truei]
MHAIKWQASPQETSLPSARLFGSFCSVSSDSEMVYLETIPKHLKMMQDHPPVLHSTIICKGNYFYESIT